MTLYKIIKWWNKKAIENALKKHSLNPEKPEMMNSELNSFQTVHTLSQRGDKADVTVMKGSPVRVQ